MLALTRVTKRYRNQLAVDAVDLELASGGTTVLIGPSGCGKSTLLRLMIGLLTPDEGRVQFDGQPLAPQNLRTIRHRMGYVIQDGGLFPHLSARDNVLLLARHVGWDVQRCEHRLVELADLTHFPRDGLDRYPVQLSGGQRQRVSLMRALMLEPEVLLLDEPLGALDPMIRTRLQDELRVIFRELGKTVVLVTHDLVEAAFFADDIVLMQSGRIVQRGTIADLRDGPESPFVTEFIEAQRRSLDPSEAAG